MMDKTKVNLGEYRWQVEHPRVLGLTPGRDLELPDCAWTTPNTDVLLDRLRRSAVRAQVEMNMVVVSPNEGELPIRTMSYVLNAMRNIRAMRSKGIPVNIVRLINPCHVNAVCDIGNLEYQLAYGQRMMDSMTTWIYESFPDLRDLVYVLDQGQTLDGSLSSLMDHARQYVSKIGHTELFQTVLKRMDRHGGQSEDMAALYLLAHPYAWRYSLDGLMFSNKRDDVGTINFLPQSEMLYLRTMQEAGITLDPLNNNVATLVSSNIVHAPYLWISEQEPILNWSVNQSDLMKQRALWKSDSRLNHTLVGKEIMGALGSILNFIQTGK